MRVENGRWASPCGERGVRIAMPSPLRREALDRVVGKQLHALSGLDA
jgi:hypothetical protein